MRSRERRLPASGLSPQSDTAVFIPRINNVVYRVREQDDLPTPHTTLERCQCTADPSTQGLHQHHPPPWPKHPSSHLLAIPGSKRNGTFCPREATCQDLDGCTLRHSGRRRCDDLEQLQLHCHLPAAPLTSGTMRSKRGSIRTTTGDGDSRVPSCRAMDKHTAMTTTPPHKWRAPGMAGGSQSPPKRSVAPHPRMSTVHSPRTRKRVTSTLSGGRMVTHPPRMARGIKFRELEEDAPTAFLTSLFHVRGTVHEHIWPQLLLVLAVSIFAYAHNGSLGNTGYFSNIAHAGFGTLRGSGVGRQKSRGGNGVWGSKNRASLSRCSRSVHVRILSRLVG